MYFNPLFLFAPKTNGRDKKYGRKCGNQENTFRENGDVLSLSRVQNKLWTMWHMLFVNSWLFFPQEDWLWFWLRIGSRFVCGFGLFERGFQFDLHDSSLKVRLILILFSCLCRVWIRFTLSEIVINEPGSPLLPASSENIASSPWSIRIQSQSQNRRYYSSMCDSKNRSHRPMSIRSWPD